jgi:hypothetical protein
MAKTGKNLQDINKENFLKEIQPIINDKVLMLLIKEGTPKYEIDNYYFQEYINIEFLENCIDMMYLQKENELLKNIYTRLQQIEYGLQLNSEQLDTILKFNNGVNNEITIADTNLREWIIRKKEVITCLSNYLKQYIVLIEPTPQQKEIEPIDSTLHQQFLIFHYLFKHLNISTNSIDKTQIARFIQFATQKQIEAKKIQNTSIYKLVDNPFNGYIKDNGTTQTNLQKVRDLFESIGLKEIANTVSKDII